MHVSHGKLTAVPRNLVPRKIFFFLRSTCTSDISDKRRLPSPPAKRRAASFLFPSCDTRAGYHRVASRTIGYQLEILLMLSDISCHRLRPFNPMQSVPDY